MSFDVEDRLRSLERDYRQLFAMMSRVPIRPAIFEGGGGGGSVDIKIVLIDHDIDGVMESEPQKFLTEADIPLTEEEEEDEYEVVFQDPPNDDYDENQIDELNLWRYKRVRANVKYYKTTEIKGTATAGASTTITLAVGSSSENDFHNGDVISITAGTGSGQTKSITDYVGSTRVATVESAWSTNPDATSEYKITSAANCDLATTTTDDAENDPPRKIVRYATTDVWYDDGKPWECGEYERHDYPDLGENDTFPPEGLPEGFLTKRYRGIAINGVLITALCKELPPPELPEE